MTLKVVDTINVTEAVLTASGIPEPDASVGEAPWQDEAERVVVGNFVLPTGYGRLHHIMQNDFGEHYLLVQAFPGTAYKIAKYDADYNFIYDYGDFSDILSVDANAEPEGIANNGNTVYVFWKVAGNNYYEQLITNIGQEGDVPLTYTTSTGQLINIPAEVKSANRTFFTVSSGNKFVLFSDNQGGSEYTEVKLYKLSQSGSLISSVGTGIFSGNAQYLSSNKDGGVIATVSTDYSTEQTDFIEYDTDLTPIKLGSVNFSKYSYVPSRITSYFDGAITWTINSKLSAVTSAEFTVLSRTITNLGAYKKGDEVILTDTHRRYRCLVSETFSNPKDTATGDAAAEWIDIGSTNKWKMFNGTNSSQSFSASSFSVTLEDSGYIGAFGVINSSGLTDVRIEVFNQSNVKVHDETVSAFDVSGSPGDFIYLRDDVFYKKEIYSTSIPHTNNFRAVITFNGSDISVGTLLVGPVVELGSCLAETQRESLDLSTQEFDQFGNETYVERPIITIAKYETITEMEKSNAVSRFLNILRRKGCLWIGELKYGQSVVTYGRIERDPIPFEFPDNIQYSIRVRGFV